MIVEIDKDLEDIFPRYLQARRDDLVKLRDCLSQGDFAFLQNFGHKIAGNAGAYGLDVYGKLARQLEAAARSHDAKECASCVESMANYLHALEARFV